MAHGFFPTRYHMCLNLNVFRTGKLLPSSTTPYCLVPHASLAAQMVKNLSAMQETWVWLLGQEDPPEKWLTTHSSTLAWRIPWRELWQATVQGVAKSQALLSD